MIKMEKNKKEVLKFLNRIGVDTRFISFTQNRIFINNLRFSKFSRKREEIFKNHFKDIEVIRSTLFQKICVKTSKILSKSISPREKILLFDNKDETDILLYLILEPYSRKYGIDIIKTDFRNFDELLNSKIDFDSIASNLYLEEEVTNVLNDIFSGKKILDYKKRNPNYELHDLNVIYPLIYVSKAWIDDFMHQYFKDYFKKSSNLIDHEENIRIINSLELNKNQVANSFMDFLNPIIPSYKENILKSSIYLNDNY